MRIANWLGYTYGYAFLGAWFQRCYGAGGTAGVMDAWVGGVGVGQWVVSWAVGGSFRVDCT